MAKELFPRKVKEVICKEVQQRAILLDLRDGSYFEVGPVGLAIWKRCDGRVPSRVIAKSIAGAFGVPAARAERDLRAFLSDLIRRGMVEL